MNILVIGNGFDLAHGLPTKYTDFLDWVKELLKIKEWIELDDEIPSKIEELDRWLLNNEKYTIYFDYQIVYDYLNRNAERLCSFILEEFGCDKNPNFIFKHLDYNNYKDFQREILRDKKIN